MANYGITFADNSPCLKHHGVLGQKWGKRNGPPYPLDDSISTGKSLKKQNKKAAKAEAKKVVRLDRGYTNQEIAKTSGKAALKGAALGAAFGFISGGPAGAVASALASGLGSAALTAVVNNVNRARQEKYVKDSVYNALQSEKANVEYNKSLDKAIEEQSNIDEVPKSYRDYYTSGRLAEDQKAWEKSSKERLAEDPNLKMLYDKNKKKVMSENSINSIAKAIDKERSGTSWEKFSSLGSTKEFAKMAVKGFDGEKVDVNTPEGMYTFYVDENGNLNLKPEFMD